MPSSDVVVLTKEPGVVTLAALVVVVVVVVVANPLHTLSCASHLLFSATRRTSLLSGTPFPTFQQGIGQITVGGKTHLIHIWYDLLQSTRRINVDSLTPLPSRTISTGIVRFNTSTLDRGLNKHLLKAQLTFVVCRRHLILNLLHNLRSKWGRERYVKMGSACNSHGAVKRAGVTGAHAIAVLQS